MIKIERINVSNIENAFHGMRNPLNSWSQSDSYIDEKGIFVIGPKDLDLAHRLIRSGSDHRKFLRQIFVSMDITAPLYWWKEMDTYKVGTVANSCSTMHKLASTPITQDCFSFDAVTDDLQCFNCNIETSLAESICNLLENYRNAYLKTKDTRYWRALIQLLPESWNQLRTWTGDFENLLAIKRARDPHKLIEWPTLCNIIDGIPYAEELITFMFQEKNEQ